MKKTLIALAVAASAAVSGSAMAWTVNGSGAPVEMGGTLTPQTKVTPWEVKTASPLTNLDAGVQKGQKTINISIKEDTGLLSIRNANANGFTGTPDIIPVISYSNVVDLQSFSSGQAMMSLDVFNSATGNKIGTLSSGLSAAAVVSTLDGQGNGSESYMYSDGSVSAFSGGLPLSDTATFQHGSFNVIKRLGGEDALANYIPRSSNGWSVTGNENFSDNNSVYSSSYVSGFLKGTNIAITLDSPAPTDAPLAWKASLPVNIIYQ